MIGDPIRGELTGTRPLKLYRLLPDKREIKIEIDLREDYDSIKRL